MIDLHSHTSASDGTLSPAELIEAAAAAQLEALAITDHDTFSGYDAAVPLAAEAGIELICGIELSVKWRGRSVHLLGYFFDGGAPEGFRAWATAMLEAREDRNRRLARELQAHGVGITLEEVHERSGPLAARPHFASLLLEKGYVATLQQAFDEYLGEGAKCYVPRDEPQFDEAARRIAEHGGISSVAHPGRTWSRAEVAASQLRSMLPYGLDAIEAWHSDHSPETMEFYKSLARTLGIGVSGGSDFHGANKPSIRLGTGRDGKLSVPREVLEDLRALR